MIDFLSGLLRFWAGVTVALLLVAVGLAPLWLFLAAIFYFIGD